MVSIRGSGRRTHTARLLLRCPRVRVSNHPTSLKPNQTKPDQVEPRHTEPSLTDKSICSCRPTQRQQRRKDDLVAHLYALDPPPVPHKPSFCLFAFDSLTDTMEAPVPRTDIIISQLLLFSQIGKKLGRKKQISIWVWCWHVMLWTFWTLSKTERCVGRICCFRYSAHFCVQILQLALNEDKMCMFISFVETHITDVHRWIFLSWVILREFRDFCDYALINCSLSGWWTYLIATFSRNVPLFILETLQKRWCVILWLYCVY